MQSLILKCLWERLFEGCKKRRWRGTNTVHICIWEYFITSPFVIVTLLPVWMWIFRSRHSALVSTEAQNFNCFSQCNVKISLNYFHIEWPCIKRKPEAVATHIPLIQLCNYQCLGRCIPFSSRILKHFFLNCKQEKKTFLYLYAPNNRRRRDLTGRRCSIKRFRNEIIYFSYLFFFLLLK